MLRNFTFHLALFGVLLALASCGCLAPKTHQASLPPSLLRPASASDDSVTLEIFFARFSLGADDLNQELWNLVDEQHLDSETRRQLARNGMRAGIVGTQIPDPLAQLMQLSDRPLTEDEKKQGVSLDVEPRVSKRLLQLRFGKRGEIVASPVVEELSLLMTHNEVLEGKTLLKAQAVFTAQVERHDGRSSLLSLLPELRHGQPQQQWTGQDGILRLDMSRDREIFEQLQIKTAIAPGQILLIGCQATAPGSLGHHFFTEDSSEGRIQKLLVIRAVQVPSDPVFSDH